jgi:hypothetical protein
MGGKNCCAVNRHGSPFTEPNRARRRGDGIAAPVIVKLGNYSGLPDWRLF